MKKKSQMRGGFVHSVFSFDIVISCIYEVYSSLNVSNC